MKKEWYTTQSVASDLQVHVGTVRRWIRTGKLKGFNLGLNFGYRVKSEDLAEFVKKRSLKSADDSPVG